MPRQPLKVKNVPLDIDMVQITDMICQKYRLSFAALFRLMVLDPERYVHYYRDLFPADMHKATVARARRTNPAEFDRLVQEDRQAQADDAVEPPASEPKTTRPFQFRPLDILQADLARYSAMESLTEKQAAFLQQVRDEIALRCQPMT